MGNNTGSRKEKIETVDHHEKRIAQHSVILVEGKLEKQKRVNMTKQWVTKWFILRKDTNLNGHAFLECYDVNNHRNDAKYEKIIDISLSVAELQIVPNSQRGTRNLLFNKMLPQNVNLTDDIDSDKPYTFILKMRKKNKVFSAVNEESFIKWIRNLNAAKWYRDPNEVVSIFKGLNLLDEVIKKSICSFLIEHYFDSGRIHLISSVTFGNIFAQFSGRRDDTMAEMVLRSLQQMVPFVNMGWKGVATALRQEIDLKTAKVVESVADETRNLGPQAAIFLASSIDTRTNLTLNVTERKYIRNLISRITSFAGVEHLSPIPSKGNPADLDPRWQDLNQQLIRDVFNTHKVFIFGSFQCRQYGLKDFKTAVQFAETKYFGNHQICSSLLSSKSFRDKATLHPNYLIHDDLFEICNYIFAISYIINQKLKSTGIGAKLDLFCCVVPEIVVSLYDHNVVYEHSVHDVHEWLSTKGIESESFQMIERTEDFATHLEDAISKRMRSRSGEKALVILIDRRAGTMNGVQNLFIFQCADFGVVTELTETHFIGMRFLISDQIKKVWLHYGNGQRLRFWPEQLVWFIPRLFVKEQIDGHTFIQKLYADDYKHGFCLNLNDPVFNKYYKMLTSWTHQSVNYRRPKKGMKHGKQIGLRDYIQRQMWTFNLGQSAMVKLEQFLDENEYCSDTVHDDLGDGDWKRDSNISRSADIAQGNIAQISSFVTSYKRQNLGLCTGDNVQELWRCPFARSLMKNLSLFEERDFVIDHECLHEFDHSAIIRALDHLVGVHNMFSIGNRKRIQHFFMNQIYCSLDQECSALRHHCSRRREVEDMQMVQEEQKYNEMDTTMSVTQSVLSSAHCYLLHAEETLYRISGQSRKFELLPFSTLVKDDEVNEEKKGDEDDGAPLSIDFGEHILQWLSYGEHSEFSSFEEEMIANPLSTLSPEIWDEFKLQCMALLECREWASFRLNELLCLKIYSDCTKLQNVFRRSYWKSASKELKKQFYNWGLLMYQTFLYHGRPIMKYPGGSGPSPLYHGLNKLFRVHDTEPTYQGPFSTTTNNHVANSFADGKGLRFKIQSSYTNPLRFIVGIDMMRISCFKHEKEVLLLSQTLPIESTKAFEKQDEVLVNHFMFSVKSRTTQIGNNNAFFRRIGVRYKPRWKDMILSHPQLLTQSAFQQETVLERLGNKTGLGIEEFSSENWKISPWRPIVEAVHSKREEFLSITCNQFRVNNHQSAYLQQHRNDFIYWLQIGESVHERDYQFNEDGHFDFQDLISSVISKQSMITLRVKPVDDSRCSLPIKTFDAVKLVFLKYKISEDTPVEIDWKLQPKRPIQVQTNSDFSITNQGAITSKQLRSAESIMIHKRFEYLRMLQAFSKLSAKEAQDIEEAFGGCILTPIALRSLSDITNNGILRCSGVHENIVLCAEGIIANHGVIQCGPNGRLYVQCNEFVNEGLTSSLPDILIVDRNERKDMHLLKVLWNGVYLKKIPLSVYRYRSSGAWSHPRNLLDEKGTQSYYWSYPHTPTKGDWIIFNIENGYIVIPKVVIIRNDTSVNALKSIELSIGSDGAGNDFDDLAVIDHIHNDNKKEQRFSLKISNATMWLNNYKFLKLKVVRNWGGYWNAFYSFVVEGVECTSIE